MEDIECLRNIADNSSILSIGISVYEAKRLDGYSEEESFKEAVKIVRTLNCD